MSGRSPKQQGGGRRSIKWPSGVAPLETSSASAGSGPEREGRSQGSEEASLGGRKAGRGAKSRRPEEPAGRAAEWKTGKGRSPSNQTRHVRKSAADSRRQESPRKPQVRQASKRFSTRPPGTTNGSPRTPLLRPEEARRRGTLCPLAPTACRGRKKIVAPPVSFPRERGIPRVNTGLPIPPDGKITPPPPCRRDHSFRRTHSLIFPSPAALWIAPTDVSA